MKSLRSAILSASIILATRGIGQGQTPPPTVDGYLAAAKAAAGTDWAGTFVRMCIPPPAGAARAPGGNQTIPVRETWYAKPAKIADNFYFPGTKIHSAWALVGRPGHHHYRGIVRLRRKR